MAVVARQVAVMPAAAVGVAEAMVAVHPVAEDTLDHQVVEAAVAAVNNFII
jgi:hypothetical protein